MEQIVSWKNSAPDITVKFINKIISNLNSNFNINYTNGASCHLTKWARIGFMIKSVLNSFTP